MKIRSKCDSELHRSGNYTKEKIEIEFYYPPKEGPRF